MPIDRQRYPSNCSEIALSIKEAAGWCCRHCHRQCLRPGEKPKHLTCSEWTVATLSVHHANFIPEDNGCGQKPLVDAICATLRQRQGRTQQRFAIALTTPLASLTSLTFRSP